MLWESLAIICPVLIAAWIVIAVMLRQSGWPEREAAGWPLYGPLRWLRRAKEPKVDEATVVTMLTEADRLRGWTPPPLSRTPEEARSQNPE